MQNSTFGRGGHLLKSKSLRLVINKQPRSVFEIQTGTVHEFQVFMNYEETWDARLWVSQDAVPTRELDTVYCICDYTLITISLFILFLTNSLSSASPFSCSHQLLRCILRTTIPQQGIQLFSIEGNSSLMYRGISVAISDRFFSVILLYWKRHEGPNTTAFLRWHESLLHALTVTQTKMGTQT